LQKAFHASNTGDFSLGFPSRVKTAESSLHRVTEGLTHFRCITFKETGWLDLGKPFSLGLEKNLVC
jgi:hypothetical protein